MTRSKIAEANIGINLKPGIKNKIQRYIWVFFLRNADSIPNKKTIIISLTVGSLVMK